MSVSPENRLRYRAVLISREVKRLFKAAPAALARLAPRRSLARWFLRAMFLSAEGTVHRAGEIVLADLRDFARVGLPVFDPEPLVMARRLGRREVVERLINYLNLDEASVQALMQIDDGLGG